MHERLSRILNAAGKPITALSKRISGSKTALLVAGTGAASLLLSGIAIAFAIHSASEQTGEGLPELSQQQRELVRPVRMQDFRFPRMHLDGPEGDFFRYRSPSSAWSEEEVSRLWLDLEAEAVDIVREENSELLEELLQMQP